MPTLLRPLLLITLTACSGGESLILLVDHFQTPCLDETLHLCLFVRPTEEDDWERMLEPVEGWVHPWGEVTRVRLLKSRAFTTSTAEQFNFKLDEIFESTPVDPGTTFVYPFRPSQAEPERPAATINADGLSGGLMDGKDFVCQEPDPCDVLKGALDSNGNVVINLRYGDPVSGPILVDSVLVNN